MEGSNWFHGCSVAMVTTQKSHFHKINSFRVTSFSSQGIERQGIHQNVA